MRKLFVVLMFIFLLTGCESKDSYFDRTCTIKNKSLDISDTLKKNVVFNNHDEITNVTITRIYKAKTEEGKSVIEDIKKSSLDYNNSLLKSKNVKISISKDSSFEYEIKYYLDAKNMSSSELESFDLQKNSIKYFNRMKKEGIVCE